MGVVQSKHYMSWLIDYISEFIFGETVPLELVNEFSKHPEGSLRGGNEQGHNGNTQKTQHLKGRVNFPSTQVCFVVFFLLQLNNQ